MTAPQIAAAHGFQPFLLGAKPARSSGSKPGAAATLENLMESSLTPDIPKEFRCFLADIQVLSFAAGQEKSLFKTTN